MNSNQQFLALFVTSFSFKSGLFYSCSCQYANKGYYKPCLHYIKIVMSIYCMLLANRKQLKWSIVEGKTFSVQKMTLPLYITCAKIFKPSSIRKAWLIFSIQIWHPTFCANVDDIVHKMTISPSILLLITCICNCQFDAGKSISIRCRRYRHQGKTTAI